MSFFFFLVEIKLEKTESKKGQFLSGKCSSLLPDTFLRSYSSFKDSNLKLLYISTEANC